MKKNRKLKNSWIIGVLLTLIVITFSGMIIAFLYINDGDRSQNVLEPVPVFELADIQESISENQVVPEPEPEPVFEEYDIRIMMVGDNLMHMGVVSTGRQEDGTYNFDVLYEGIADYLGKADIKIINQETILGGNSNGFSGYPKFNSPTEVGDAIAKAGFNVVLHASNHSGDMGIKGLNNCAQFWEENHPEITVTGINVDEENYRDIKIVEAGEKKFAILNYTYGPNMETVPKDIRWHLSILCGMNENNGLLDFKVLNEMVLEDIKAAKQLADVVIVCPHWGTEYVTTPSSYQEKFALEMTEAGADVIIGTHPHVVQPVAWVESENGNKSLCYYSLGNYVSTQKDPISMLEGMAWVTFHVTETDMFINEEETGVIPMVCHYNAWPVRIEGIYMLDDYSEEMAGRHGILAYGGKRLNYSDLTKWSSEIFGQFEMNADCMLRNN